MGMTRKGGHGAIGFRSSGQEKAGWEGERCQAARRPERRSPTSWCRRSHDVVCRIKNDLILDLSCALQCISHRNGTQYRIKYRFLAVAYRAVRTPRHFFLKASPSAAAVPTLRCIHDGDVPRYTSTPDHLPERADRGARVAPARDLSL